MKVNSISFYDKFICKGAECKGSCCEGWLIPVDDDSYQKYMSMKGLDGLKLFLSIGKKNGMRVLNKNTRSCPFWDKDRLCYLQKKYGEDCLCKVCSAYPRIVYNYGPCAEEYLDLSCPSVMELFLDNIDNIELITGQKDITYELYGTNDDAEYFEFLDLLRSRAIEIIEDEKLTIGQVYYYLVYLGKSLQKLFLSMDLGAGEDRQDELLKNIYEKGKLLIKEETDYQVKELFIDIVTIDKLMTGGFYHRKLKKRSKLLYILCNRYFKQFGKMNVNEIDELLKDFQNEESKELYIDGKISYNRFLRQYLKYNLMMQFMELYEDFSFIRKFTFPVIRGNLLSMLLYLLINKQEHVGNMDKEEFCMLISAFHRRGTYHNDIMDGFFNIVYDRCLKYDSI